MAGVRGKSLVCSRDPSETKKMYIRDLGSTFLWLFSFIEKDMTTKGLNVF